jgi:hypothetical protein
METTILQSSSKITVISANGHVSCAQYFDWIMNIVFDILMGRDRNLQYPTLSGGLFSFYKGFFTCMEFQGSRNFYAHWLVYTHGMPTTTLGFKNLLKIQIPHL